MYKMRGRYDLWHKYMLKEVMTEVSNATVSYWLDLPPLTYFSTNIQGNTIEFCNWPNSVGTVFHLKSLGNYLPNKTTEYNFQIFCITGCGSSLSPKVSLCLWVSHICTHKKKTKHSLSLSTDFQFKMANPIP